MYILAIFINVYLHFAQVLNKMMELSPKQQ